MADHATSEVDIEEKVCKWAQENGWLAPKLQWLNQTGWPDRTFIKDGKAVFIEFKKPGGMTSKKQDHWIVQLLSHGMSVGVFDNAKEAIDFLHYEDPKHD